MKRRRFIKNALWFAAGSTLVSACGDRGGLSASNGPEILRFSVTDVDGMEPLKENFGAFYNALGEAIALPVEPVPLDSFVAAAPALLNQQIDLVLAGPSEYLLLNARAQGVPVVAITRPNYRSRITVLADSGIETVADLKGKVFGIFSEGATAGHIGAGQLMVDAGLTLAQDVTIRTVGKKATVQALLSGEIDAFAASPISTEKILGKVEGAAEKVKVLIDGPPLPSDVFVANSALEPAFLERLTETMVSQQDTLLAALLQSPENTKYSESQLLPTQDSDYDQIRTMYRTLGLEKMIK
ncbi:MAG: phosphate/phosphite/phosphonate ABC transporter substrate-binding protein [Cyanophyceae cyanobacterium]